MTRNGRIEFCRVIDKIPTEIQMPVKIFQSREYLGAECVRYSGIAFIHGKILLKKTRKGKDFYGCSNYPKCDFASWYEPINKHCPKCNSILVKKGKKIA